jgi:hypothetical protein
MYGIRDTPSDPDDSGTGRRAGADGLLATVVADPDHELDGRP